MVASLFAEIVPTCAISFGLCKVGEQLGNVLDGLEREVAAR